MKTKGKRLQLFPREEIEKNCCREEQQTYYVHTMVFYHIKASMLFYLTVKKIANDMNNSDCQIETPSPFFQEKRVNDIG